MNKLVILRHGQSYGNLDWSICRNDHLNFLTLRGVGDAVSAAQKIAHMTFSAAFVSEYTRSRHTMAVILERLGIRADTPTMTPFINELDWDEDASRKGLALIAAESHEYTLNRAREFFVQHALPALALGNVLVVSHGGFMRSVIGELWDVVPEIAQVEFNMEHCVPYELEHEHITRFVETIQPPRPVPVESVTTVATSDAA